MKNLRLTFFLKSPLGILSIVVVVLIAAIPGYYFYQKYKDTQRLLQNSSSTAQVQVKLLVDKVGQLILLPNETPTVATVSDISKLKNQEFFKNAQNGDKVLVFTQAKQAILYRPTINKIIQVGPILSNPNQTSGAVVTPSQVRIVVYNGTNTTGLGGQIEAQIKSKFTNVNITNVTNATNKNYTTSSIVDIRGGNKELAKQLASYLNGQVNSMPAGEATPDADILVIAGK